MNLYKKLRYWLFRRKKVHQAQAQSKRTVEESRTSRLIALLQAVNASLATKKTTPVFMRYEPVEGVVPANKRASVLAHDSTPYAALNTAAMQQSMSSLPAFPGYPYLAQLAQLPEYRKITCTIAEEMTRKWIRLGSASDKSNADKLKRIEARLTDLKIRDLFEEMIRDDGFFGRGQFFIDVRKPNGGRALDDDLELRTPLPIDKVKVRKGSLIGFTRVEPVWTYPALYNSTNPLKSDFYKPTSWFVMGKEVHASRLVMMISHPVPDLLKAAYSFGGLSMSQLAEPYVNHWLRTRDAVSDIIHSFSTSGLKTSLDAYLQPGDVGGGEDLINRAKLFNQMRDNKGMLLVDKDGEEFFQFNVPLSGLDHLQAQSQEQMASVSSTPLVKLLGITPSGLNASSDGEIRVFYDFVHARQESLLRDPLTKVIELIQLDEFGEIDDDINFAFEPLYQLSALEEATKRKTEAETDGIYIEKAVVLPEEIRKRIATDDESPYNGLDLAVELPDPEAGDGEEGVNEDPDDKS
jgi:hypothetical protein